MINETVCPHRTVAGKSGTGWYSREFSVAHNRQFCVLKYPVRWKWAFYKISVHKTFHGHSLWISIPAKNSKAKVSPAGRRKVRRKQHLHMANFVRITGCFVEFYTPYSLARPMFGQCSVHCTVSHHRSTPPALLWPLLQLMSNQFFPPTIRLHIKRTHLFEFLNHCFQTHGSHVTNGFFYTLECPELLQSCSRQQNYSSTYDNTCDFSLI